MIMKKIFQVVKKVCLAIILLYGFNTIMGNANILVPINAISIIVVSVLGIPGLLSLIAMFFIL